jgi:hypothetical protein
VIGEKAEKPKGSKIKILNCHQVMQIVKRIVIKQNPLVIEKFDSYPIEIKKKLNYLRDLILKTASEIDKIQEIEETLKWEEPSYIVKKGSTFRMDWKPKSPNQYALYFNCNTSLVATFKIVFGNLLKYEKNRAILFDLDEKVPEKEIKACIKVALQYHSLKDKPFLGM